jgi:5-methylcytosine-specific restriction endonuclease McrA
MKTPYRKIPPAVVRAIEIRATENERIHCERCGIWCKLRKEYEIDHVIPERMRPIEDRKRPLRAVDGQLLCIRCHRRKTDQDVGAIASAKRIAAKHRPVAAGKTNIQRRFNV